jgi:hypothetical protein
LRNCLESTSGSVGDDEGPVGAAPPQKKVAKEGKRNVVCVRCLYSDPWERERERKDCYIVTAVVVLFFSHERTNDNTFSHQRCVVWHTSGE